MQKSKTPQSKVRTFTTVLGGHKQRRMSPVYARGVTQNFILITPVPPKQK